MTLPFELRQKDITIPPGMAEAIQIRAEKLTRFHSRIQRCIVTVEGPSPHHRQGACDIRIDLHVPGGELVVRKQGAATLELALKSAFEAMGRRLEDQVRRIRGFVKTHEPR